MAEKKIRIDSENLPAIQAIIDSVEIRCRVRCLTAKQIVSIVASVEHSLSIPKNHLKGVRIIYDGAEKFPVAYKGNPTSTQFSAVFDGRSWILQSVTRDSCPNRVNNTSVFLTEDAKKALIRRFDSFHVYPGIP